MNTNLINAALEAAAKANSPRIIQLSHGDSSFFLGKGVKLTAHESAVAGAIAAAKYVHSVAIYMVCQ